MKANELRIGNLISDGFFIYKILEISKGIVKGFSTQNGEFFYPDTLYSLNEENLEGIPLTEEWLLRFGAKKINHIHGYVFWTFHNTKQNNCLIDIYENGNKTEVNSRVVNPCKYVHQLQNLYFALTGNELEIKK